MAYYGLGIKEEILASLETALLKVDGIKFVDYQRVESSGASPEKYPGLYINDVSTDKERLLQDLVKNAFGVQLVCWVWAKKDEDLATVLNAFMRDVKGEVMADPNRKHNGDYNAYDTVIENISTDAGSRHPQGMAVVNILIPFYSQE